MTEETVKQENEKVAAPVESNEPRRPTVEEEKVIRTEILKMCQGNYKRFIESLRELPLHPMAFSQCFLFFDTGALWMKEVVDYAPLMQKEPQPPVTNTVQ